MISFVQVKSNVVRIGCETEAEQKALDKLLVRKVKNYDTGLMEPVTVAWDTGFIPAGIVPWMVQKLGSKFTIDNQMWASNVSEITVDESCFVGREPRPYQINSCNVILATSRSVLQAPTGSGKTTMMSAMAHAILREHPNWRIMVLGYTKDHWGQVLADLRLTGHKCQEVGKGAPACNVIVGRFDAFERNMRLAGPWNDYIRTAEVVYYDEVRHLGSASTYINFARSIEPMRSYGFDATPLKNYTENDPYKFVEDMNVVGYCGPIKIHITTKDLQRLGYLPLTYVRFVPMPKPPQMRKTGPRNLPILSDYTKIYKFLIVENDFRTERFARLITNLAGSGKIIALIKQHEHARRLMHFLQQNDVESMAWFGANKALAVSPLRGVYDMPAGTQEVRRRFMETELPVVIGSSVLSEAISLDVATDAVNLAAGNTFALSGQRAGRIMRRDSGKTPIVNYWDADDHAHRILQAQTRKRREHYAAAGLDVVDIPCPEVCTIDFRRYGLTYGGYRWP